MTAEVISIDKKLKEKLSDLLDRLSPEEQIVVLKWYEKYGKTRPWVELPDAPHG